MIDEEKLYSEPVLKVSRKLVINKLFARTAELVVAIDVEMHDWPSAKFAWEYVGEFIFLIMCTEKQLPLLVPYSYTVYCVGTGNCEWAHAGIRDN